MRKSTIAITVLLASSAWACPDLTGTYVCPDSSQPVKITTIDKYVDNGITIMQQAQKGSVTEMRADKKAKVETLPNGAIKTQLYECTDKEFVIEEEISHPKVGSLTVARIFTLTNERDLLVVIMGTAKRNGDVLPIDDYMVCKRASDEGIPDDYAKRKSRPGIAVP